MHAAADAGGRLWLGVPNNALLRIDPQTKKVEIPELSPAPGFEFTHDELTSRAWSRATSLLAGDADTLWIGTPAGVISLDTLSISMTMFDKCNGHDYIEGTYGIAKDPRSSALWFGASELVRYDPSKQDWKRYKIEHGHEVGAGRAFAVASDGSVWIGGTHGSSRFEPEAGRWTTFRSKDGLASDQVNAIVQDTAGFIWFGTDGGVSRYDLGTGAWVTYVRPGTTRILPWLILALGLAVGGAAGALFASRRNHYLQTSPRELPLANIPTTFRAMRRYRVLDDCWSRLDLPPSRIRLVEQLAPAATATPGPIQIRALAELLGMSDPRAAEVVGFSHGIALLTATFPYPEPLNGHPIALVALDLDEARTTEPAKVRASLKAALDKAGQRFELPYLLLAAGEVPPGLLPSDLGALKIGERELRALLFAPSPERTFAGLLHARGLVALSPYATSGEVGEEQMFFGRVGLLREMLLAPQVQAIVVGPRRVGKTSLLKRLQKEIPGRHAHVEAIFVDLYGDEDYKSALRSLARNLGAKVPDDLPPEEAIAEMLRARSAETKKKCVVLFDEADGLAEADAKNGYPLLNAMRTLQAEGVCSFVLAGYLYLYRETLDQRSPLYNFATVRVVGPLEPEAARDLARVPMERLGVAYADPDLPARIAAQTGGYPSFVQTLCDALLGVLREQGDGDLVLTAAHLARAEDRVGTELRAIFAANADRDAQLLVYALLDADAFTTADAEQALSRTVGHPASRRDVENALQQLRLFGFLVDKAGSYTWAIPLLRASLRAADPAGAIEALLRPAPLSGAPHQRA
jgi:hypothetical protein